MQLFQNISIKQKLTIIIMLTSIIVLFLACASFVINDLLTFRQTMVENLTTLAEVIGSNSTAALTFNDQKAAEETLEALKADPNVIAAQIYTRAGQLFAKYHIGRENSEILMPSPLDNKNIKASDGVRNGYYYEKGYLNLFKDIVFDGESIGVVYLRSNLNELYSRLCLYVSVSATVMLASICVAYILSSKFRGIIFEPILYLTQTMKIVSDEKNYSIRAEKQTNDELGILIDGFNAMLTQIQLRDQKLENNREQLENEVNLRTSEILKANKDLGRAVMDLKKAKEVAEFANRSKSMFLANMSHELRTPLNHIIGFTELVADKHFGELNKTQEEYLGDVLQSSRHLLSLINDILDLSKVEAGKLEINTTVVKLEALLKNSLVMIKEKAMKHSIQTKCHCDNIPTTINADERKLKQILYNLLANAVKFTPDHGSIILTARHAFFDDNQCIISDGKKIDLSLSNKPPTIVHNGFLEISVEDTGIGIKPEDQRRIFDPFEQANGSSSRMYQGTGLGLSLTKRLVELHGGKIWATSEGENKGSKFNFIIPV
ncbi:MAG: HAMP domain-containing protein [Desulfobacterales bacterium]|nr:HAMP domain-containing protein [Desulfobacterales bacterium]